jgi:hypothetical protein
MGVGQRVDVDLLVIGGLAQGALSILACAGSAIRRPAPASAAAKDFMAFPTFFFWRAGG